MFEVYLVLAVGITTPAAGKKIGKGFQYWVQEMSSCRTNQNWLTLHLLQLNFYLRRDLQLNHSLNYFYNLCSLVFCPHTLLTHTNQLI